MTFDQFVNHMRSEIKEEGFMSGIELAGRIVRRLHEHGLLDKYNAERVAEAVEGGDIRRVEYTNVMAIEYNRYKDLYYYNPS